MGVTPSSCAQTVKEQLPHPLPRLAGEGQGEGLSVSASERARPHLDAGQTIEGGAGSGGRMGMVAPAARRNQPVRVIRPLCGSMVKLATTSPLAVVRSNPIAPSDACFTFATFQV